MSGGWTNLLLGTLLAPLGVFAVYWAWRALFRDRARGRDRCPRCWYDMTWSASAMCIECGYEARDATDLQRTRRYWSQAIVSILAAVTISMFFIDRIMIRGWATFLPDPLLVTATTWTNNTAGAVYTEFDRRVQAGELSDHAVARFIEHAARESNGVRSGAWDAQFGARIAFLRDRLARSRRNGPWLAAEHYLLDVPAKFKVDAPLRTHRDAPQHLFLLLDDLWPRGTEVRFEVDLHDDGTVDRALYRLGNVEMRSAWVTCPMDDPEAQTLSMMVSCRGPGDNGVWRQAAMPVRIAVLPARDRAQTPIESVLLVDEPISSVHTWRRGPSPVRFQYLPRGRPVVDGTEPAAVRIMLMSGDDMAREMWMYWPRLIRGSDWPRVFVQVIDEDIDLLRTLTPDASDGWRLVMANDIAIPPLSDEPAAVAPTMSDAKAPLPLRVVDERGTAPLIGWWTAQRLRDNGIDIDAVQGE